MTSKGQSNPLVSRNCNVRHVELLLCRITYLITDISSATTITNHYKDNDNSLISDAGVKIKFCNNFKKKSPLAWKPKTNKDKLWLDLRKCCFPTFSAVSEKKLCPGLAIFCLMVVMEIHPIQNTNLSQTECRSFVVSNSFPVVDAMFYFLFLETDGSLGGKIKLSF